MLENKGFSPTIISLENVAKLIQKEDSEGKRIIVFPWNFLKNQFFKNSKRINQILSDFNFGIAVGRWFESAYFFYQSSLPYSIWISNSILDNKKAFIESSQFPFKLGTLIYKKVIKYEKKLFSHPNGYGLLVIPQRIISLTCIKILLKNLEFLEYLILRRKMNFYLMMLNPIEI